MTSESVAQVQPVRSSAPATPAHGERPSRGQTSATCSQLNPTESVSWRYSLPWPSFTGLPWARAAVEVRVVASANNNAHVSISRIVMGAPCAGIWLGPSAEPWTPGGGTIFSRAADRFLVRAEQLRFFAEGANQLVDDHPDPRGALQVGVDDQPDVRRFGRFAGKSPL